MRIAVYEKLDDYCGRREVIWELDNQAMHRAHDIFNSYKERGIILNHSFDDTAWKLSNQAQNVGLTLISFEDDCKTAMEWIGCNYHRYLDCVKAYIIFNLGEIGLSTLREITNAFLALAKKTSNEAIDSVDYINHIIELLRIIPDGNERRDYVIETLEEKHEQGIWKRRSGKQRRLADFKTYLKFNDVLDEFWGYADKKCKLFYFPLYFWWKLTSILPLRPMEFLLTPRDCLETDDNGESILTVRRTKLKGGGRKISYCVEEDYERKKYSIPEHLAAPLRSYLSATKKMRKTKIGTLFLQKPHFEYLGRCGHILNEYYTYGNFNTCMKYFYQEVVRKKGLDLGTINFGDTRHIAMASLIISGGSPVICRELAGHSDIDISSHYFSNISNLVECATLELYRKSKVSGADIIGVSKFPLCISEDWHRLTDGWCDAPSIKERDVSECLKVSDKHRRIGVCSHCYHYHPDNPGIRLEFFDEKSGKQVVDADCQYLMRMIEMVRRGIGNTEDIGSALLRLQRSSDHYGKCLFEKYAREDGTSWQDQGN